jgi:hypothetical protein
MRSLFAAIAGLTLLTCTAAQARVDITIEKDNQAMTVAVDGVARYHWPVSTGIPSRETPNGSFRAFRMEEDHYSKEFDDAPMPHSIFFTKIGHAIHGTDSEGRLGTPASHGCVRLSKANASTLYALVQEQGVLNTTVTLTGSAQVALMRNPRRNTAVARTEPDQQYQPQYQQYPQQQYQQQYSDSGEPVVLTQQPQYFPGRRPVQRADDGYIYPADGSSDAQVYPAPRDSRRLYNAQANPQPQAYPQPQPQYYNNQQGYPAPQGYYQQQRQYYPPRGYYSQD